MHNKETINKMKNNLQIERKQLQTMGPPRGQFPKYIKYAKTAHTDQYKKLPSQKLRRRFKYIFLQKRHTDNQQAH